jgi:hypothetical protein
MARMFTDHDGELRGTLIMAVVALSLMMLGLTGIMALMFGGIIGANAVATWVIAAFLFVKIPLLALIWWVLGRKRERGQVGGWSSRECHEILEYLEREARAGMARPNAHERLAYYCREAWFVAGSAAPEDIADAVATATRIDALASEAGVDTERARAEAMTAGAGA